MEYPLELSFKIFSIGSRISVTDASGALVAYARQRAFRLREEINIYADEDQQQHLYTIQANQVLDFNASYAITAPDGNQLGSVGRRGMRSLWRASYDIVNPSGNQIGSIHEEDPWVKAVDGMIGAVPVVGAVTGYFLHPAYLVDVNGSTHFRVQKQPAFFEGRYKMEQHNGVAGPEQDLILPSAIMVLLLERYRG